MEKFHVTEVTVSSSRKFNLGNYETAEIHASATIQIDEDGNNEKTIKEAYDKGRSLVRDELVEQYKPLKKYFKKDDKSN